MTIALRSKCHIVFCFKIEINAPTYFFFGVPVLPVLAFYIVAAEEQGVKRELLAVSVFEIKFKCLITPYMSILHISHTKKIYKCGKRKHYV